MAEETYLDRLKVERDDLKDKLDKLSSALIEKKVPDSERMVLSKQQIHMENYLAVLNERLGRAC